MARVRNPNREKAFELYKAHRDIKLIDIANKLGIPEGTVRGWKNKDQWDNKINGTFQEKPKRNGTKTEQNKNRGKPIAKEVEEVLSNTELTEKQRLFCVLYAKYLNATKAYQKAYHCTYETAMVNGSNLLRNIKVKEQIDILIASEFDKEFLKRSVIQKYIDIAFSDIGDYVKFGKVTKKVWTKDKDGIDIPVVDPETGEQKETTYNYVDLKESSMVDTTLISEISEGKDGIKFKLADKMKAMDFLTKHCNLLNDEEKTKLDLEYKKLQNRKVELETAVLETDGSSDIVKDDGFIAALKGTVEEVVWADEEIN